MVQVPLRQAHRAEVVKRQEAGVAVAGELAGVGLLVICTILTAPAAPEQGSGGVNWWVLLAGGTALALVGVPLGLVLEAPGGLLTAFGGGMAIVGVVFGMPT